MPKLFMLLIGCSLPGRHIEQHDVFFGIGENIKEVLQDAIAFWPEAKNSFHLDGWREVTQVDGYRITVIPAATSLNSHRLFFINLGGYKKGEFEEFHYKMITVAADKNEAILRSKQSAFFKHTGFKSATAHIDDKYGVDVDDILFVNDILSPSLTLKFSLLIDKIESGNVPEDQLHLGYFKPGRVDSWYPASS